MGRWGVFTPKRTQDAEKAVAAIVRRSWKREPLQCPIVVRIQFQLPWPKSTPQKNRLDVRHTKRPDIDNLGKLVMDALNGIVWVDDSCVWNLEQTKIYGPTPKINLQVEW